MLVIVSTVPDHWSFGSRPCLRIGSYSVFAFPWLLLSPILIILSFLDFANEPTLDGMVRIKRRKQLYDRGMDPWPTTPVNALCLFGLERGQDFGSNLNQWDFRSNLISEWIKIDLIFCQKFSVSGSQREESVVTKQTWSTFWFEFQRVAANCAEESRAKSQGFTWFQKESDLIVGFLEVWIKKVRQVCKIEVLH